MILGEKWRTKILEILSTWNVLPSFLKNGVPRSRKGGFPPSMEDNEHLKFK
jgi:hypothetical protein